MFSCLFFGRLPVLWLHAWLNMRTCCLLGVCSLRIVDGPDASSISKVIHISCAHTHIHIYIYTHTHDCIHDPWYIYIYIIYISLSSIVGINGSSSAPGSDHPQNDSSRHHQVTEFFWATPQVAKSCPFLNCWSIEFSFAMKTNQLVDDTN